LKIQGDVEDRKKSLLQQKTSNIGLGLGLDMVPGWLEVTHASVYYFPLSLSFSLSSDCGETVFTWSKAVGDDRL